VERASQQGDTRTGGDWARELREELSGPSKDLLVGTKTVGELDDEALALLVAIASARARYSGYLAEQLGLEEPIQYSVWSAEEPEDDTNDGS
jgi:hypothetical protein